MKLKVIQTQPDNQNIKPEIFQIYGINYSETLIETKKKKCEFQMATLPDYRHHKQSYIPCFDFFQFNNDLARII